MFNKDKLDFTITRVNVEFWGKHERNDGGVVLSWGTANAGFGECTFYLQDGKMQCQNECMSKEFIKTLFDFMLENTEFEDNK